MRRAIVITLAVWMLAAPVIASATISTSYGLSANGSTDWVDLRRGLYIFELWAPDDTNADDSCDGGGSWGTTPATATVEYSPDGGITSTNVTVTDLGGGSGVSADAVASVQVAQGYSFRVTLTSVDTDTCINFRMAKSQ